MNPQTITLTSQNAAGLAWVVKLTGFSLEEIVNILLSDLVKEFQPGNPDELCENTFGNWQFKTKGDAERTLQWVKSRRKVVESEIRSGRGGYEIDAFGT